MLMQATGRNKLFQSNQLQNLLDIACCTPFLQSTNIVGKKWSFTKFSTKASNPSLLQVQKLVLQSFPIKQTETRNCKIQIHDDENRRKLIKKVNQYTCGHYQIKQIIQPVDSLILSITNFKQKEPKQWITRIVTLAHSKFQTHIPPTQPLKYSTPYNSDQE